MEKYNFYRYLYNTLSLIKSNIYIVPGVAWVGKIKYLRGFIMTVINKNTQRGKGFIRSWERGEYASSIFDVYERPSRAKENAFNSCFSQYANEPGSRNFRVTGHNSCFFTVAWLDGNGNLRVETAQNSYIVK